MRAMRVCASLSCLPVYTTGADVASLLDGQVKELSMKRVVKVPDGVVHGTVSRDVVNVVEWISRGVTVNIHVDRSMSYWSAVGGVMYVNSFTGDSPEF